MRRVLVSVLVVLVPVFGVGVYLALGALRTHAFATPDAPTQERARINLPGSVYVVQGGVIYRLRNRTFKPLLKGGWMQPSAAGDGKELVAVLRHPFYSDVYEVDLDGRLLRQLTNNYARGITNNHWSFYPRLTRDGGTLFYTWDPRDPANQYRVDLAVYSLTVSRGQSSARQWSRPNPFTGGDVQPVPLPNGGVLYAKYNISPAGTNYSQIWIQTSPSDPGQALTPPGQDCQEPALSPAGTWLAMICTSATQSARLEVASFANGRLGPLSVLVENELVAAPSWSPKGTALLYFAPVGASGHFQLLYLALPQLARPNGSPAAHRRPVQVTTGLNLDATSPAAWVG